MAPLLWSGAGQVITSLCESQAATHDVRIVTSGVSRGERDWPSYRRRLSRAGIRHTRIDFFDREPAVFWPSVTALRALVNGWQPDVVHTHAGAPACGAAAVRSHTRVPFRFISHVYSWGLNRPSWMNDMDAAGHQQADLVVCSAAAYRERLVESGVDAGRIALVPWGLAPATVSTDRVRSGRRRSGVRLGFVGRIEPRKEQLALVRGFALAARRLTGARLDLVGPVGDRLYAEAVADEIRRHRLGRAVRLRGRVASVPAAIADWDLFVSLSRDEGQGLAILEAMALGVPVAARVVPGVEDYFKPDVNGIPVESARATDVAAAILRGTNNPRRLATYARRGRRLAAGHYSWTRTVRDIERLYHTEQASQ